MKKFLIAIILATSCLSFSSVTQAANSQDDLASFFKELQSATSTQVNTGKTSMKTTTTKANWKNAERFLNELRQYVKTR